MAIYPTRSHIVSAVIDRLAWPEAWLSLLSYKGHVQGVHDFLEMRIAAEEEAGGRLLVDVETIWHSQEALEVFAARGDVETLFRELDPPAESIRARVRLMAT